MAILSATEKSTPRVCAPSPSASIVSIRSIKNASGASHISTRRTCAPSRSVVSNSHTRLPSRPNRRPTACARSGCPYLCVCVCVRACVCACVCARVCARVHACVLASAGVGVSVCAPVHARVRALINRCIHMRHKGQSIPAMSHSPPPPICARSSLAGMAGRAPAAR